MAIRPLKEVNRAPGLLPLKDVNGNNVPEILGGQPVRLIDANTLTLATGTVTSATNTVIGISADTSVPYSNSNNSQYSVQATDDYAKGGLVGYFEDGGTFEVWNDGRGPIFAANVINVGSGVPLYVDGNGLYTITPGSASTLGLTAIAVVVSAPTSATDSLVLKLLR